MLNVNERCQCTKLGPRVREIFKQLTETGNDDNYEVAKAKLKDYFDPSKNRRYEVYHFRQDTQKPDETLNEYHTRLRTMSTTSESTTQS